MPAISERRVSTISLLEKDAKSGRHQVDGSDLFGAMPEISELVQQGPISRDAIAAVD